jgi:hypothetical protein
LGGDGQSALVGTAFGASLQVRVLDSQGRAVADGTVVTFAAQASGASGTFEASRTRTDTAATSGGLATASALVANTVAGSHVVSVTSGGAPAIEFSLSNAPGPARQLSFSVQPENALAGSTIPGPPTVAVQDQFANTVPAVALVTVSIGANPGRGNLTGTTTRATVAGVARFTDLAITEAGEGYRLAAAGPGLQGAISAAFNVTAGAAGVARFSIAPIAGPKVAGLPFAITITAEDARGNPATTFTGRARLATSAGTIAPSTSGPFVGGTRTEMVTVSQAGLGRTISVSDRAGHGGASNAFEVSPGQAARLAFVIAPGHATAGLAIPGPPTVAVQDALGNAVGAPAAFITIGLAAGSPAGSLTGARTKSTSDGVARFGDLALDRPGAGYRLQASAGGLSSAISPPFTVVDASSIPAELNREAALLSAGHPASFEAGAELVIQFQSQVKVRFRKATTIVPEAVSPLTLRLQRGQIEASAKDISLRLATAHGEVRVEGTAEFGLTADAETTLEVHAGSVRFLGSEARAVPAGSRLVADSSGIRSTELRLTQPLLLSLPGLATFLALSNPAPSTADVTLTALDPAGAPLAGTANPRIIQLGPRGLISESAAALFGLDPATPAVGSIRIATPSLDVRGASFVGDVPFNRLSSGGLTGRRLAGAVIPEEGGQFLVLANPGPQPLTVSVARYGALGDFAGEALASLPGHGVQIQRPDDLLGPPPGGGPGSLRLTAASRFTAFAVAAGGRFAEGPAESLDGLGDHLFAPFVAGIPGVAATTLSLINASAVPVRSALRLYDASGRPIPGATDGPVFDVLPAGARRLHHLEELFRFDPGERVAGWLEVVGVPTLPGAPARLMATVTIGHPSGEPFHATLPLAAAGRSETSVPFLLEGSGLFSFVALLNPSPDRSATVTLEAVGPGGSVTTGEPLRLGPRTTVFGLVRHLLPGLPLPFGGSLHLRAQGPGIIASGLGGDEAQRFLTLLPTR